MVERYAAAYATALHLRIPPPATEEQLRWRRHDWWDRPMAFTDIPPRPQHALDLERFDKPPSATGRLPN
jgi:hypothetical protein